MQETQYRASIYNFRIYLAFPVLTIQKEKEGKKEKQFAANWFAIFVGLDI